MASPTITCYKCKQNHFKPNTIPFKVDCYRCGTIIGSDDGDALWYDLSNYNEYWSKERPEKFEPSEDPYGRVMRYVFGVALGIMVIAVVILSIKSLTEWVRDEKPEQPIANNAMPVSVESNSNSNSLTSSRDTKPSEDIEIYSGKCTYSEKELNGNLMTLKPISSGFAKVVINRKLKKLYFYYNNELVFHYFGYSSYTDDIEGGEGFTFDSDADAHRFTAERVFQLNTERIMGGQLGYQYEIVNYNEN